MMRRTSFTAAILIPERFRESHRAVLAIMERIADAWNFRFFVSRKISGVVWNSGTPQNTGGMAVGGSACGNRCRRKRRAQ